jgi:hypothetical protein
LELEKLDALVHLSRRLEGVELPKSAGVIAHLRNVAIAFIEKAKQRVLRVQHTLDQNPNDSNKRPCTYAAIGVLNVLYVVRVAEERAGKPIESCTRSCSEHTNPHLWQSSVETYDRALSAVRVTLVCANLNKLAL